MMRRLVLTAILGVVCGSSFAQEGSSRVAVHMQQQCADDVVGQRLAFKIREGLNASSSMKAVDEYGEALVEISLVCLRPDENANGSISRYSYQVTLINPKDHYDFALTHGVGSCGTQRVAECAEGIVATVDRTISELRARIKSGRFKWPPE